MNVKIKEVRTCNLYKNLNDGSGGRSFVGMKVSVTLQDGRVIRFKTDYIMGQPRKVISKVIQHVYTRSGLPDGVLDLVTII